MTMNPASRAALRAACALLSLTLTLSCATSETLSFEHAKTSLQLSQPALYPETIEYNSKTDKFLVSSFRKGAVYQVDDQGQVSQLVTDERLCSVLGIALDVERDRLWAVSSDLASSARPSVLGPKKLAAVGVYSLSTGAAIHYVDLADLSAGPHLLNGIALDHAGNAYVTDSFSPVIYQVDPQGRARVFLQSAQFAGEGINLNGVVVHPDGYLLVVKKSDGSLFKVPLADPEHFSKVSIDQTFIGGDGLSLIGSRSLVIIANQTPDHASNAAFSLTSDDGWASAKLREAWPLGDVYPTTAVLRHGKLYMIHSHLNKLIAAPPEDKAQLHERATIEQIGTLSH